MQGKTRRLTAGLNTRAANSRNVWTIASSHRSLAHHAMMPPELAERCIKAGTRRGDTVARSVRRRRNDLLVADRLGRNAVGCELSAEHAATAKRRIVDDAPLLVAAE